MDRARKQKLVRLARAMGVLPLLDAMHFIRAKQQSAEGNRLFINDRPGFSPPPLRWMHDMYRHTSFSQYWRTGKETAAGLAELIDQHCTVERPRVADWGCGLSRVLRHLPDRFDRFGFDYNPHAIKWCADHISGVSYGQNQLMPPLPAEDAAFDVVYALSVFTHLSAPAHEAWIKEIIRVLAPGGLFMGAFHMEFAPGQLLEDEQRRFDAGELIVRGGVKEGSRTYVAYHPEQYLREVLFRDIAVVAGPIPFYGQTLFVVRKTP